MARRGHRRHVERIGILCERLALAAGFSATDAETLRHAAVLHDVGKIGVPDRVLLKPERLDEEEWEIMKTHAEIGASMLAGSPSPLVQLGEEIARTHHERWNGTGYPAGLRGEEIPLAGASARSATSSTPCARAGPTRTRGRWTRRSPRSSASAAATSTPPWSICSCRWPPGWRPSWRCTTRAGGTVSASGRASRGVDAIVRVGTIR